jgi:hypothetical protein
MEANKNFNDFKEKQKELLQIMETDTKTFHIHSIFWNCCCVCVIFSVIFFFLLVRPYVAYRTAIAQVKDENYILAYQNISHTVLKNSEEWEQYIHYNLVKEYFNNQNYELVLEELKELKNSRYIDLLEIKDITEKSNFYIGRQYYREQDWGHAVAYLNKLTSIEYVNVAQPMLEESYYYLGCEKLELGNYEGAATYFSKTNYGDSMEKRQMISDLNSTDDLISPYKAERIMEDYLKDMSGWWDVTEESDTELIIWEHWNTGMKGKITVDLKSGDCYEESPYAGVDIPDDRIPLKTVLLFNLKDRPLYYEE